MPRAAPLLSVFLIFIVLSSVTFAYYGYYGHWPLADDGNDGLEDLLDEYRPILKKQTPMVLRKDDFEQLSPWQGYVTPDDPAIVSLASGMDSIEDAYKEAVSWTWVSDDVLHKQPEKWIYPHEFIIETPTYASNPVKGEAVSDCEEQAYSLVSLLRAFGVPATDVRVTVGEITVGDDTGGHAWAEIYHDGRWLPLEATSGPYWDEEQQRQVKRKGGGLNYYATHDYPVVEVWGHFNDLYYYNPIKGTGNAPGHWN